MRIVERDDIAGLAKVTVEGTEPPLTRWVRQSEYAAASLATTASAGWTTTAFGRRFGERADVLVEIGLHALAAAVGTAQEEVKHYGECTYASFPAVGLSLCFDGTGDAATRRLACVHAVDQRCTLVLPHGISIGMTGAAVVELLGEPDRKGGGGRGGGITIAYVALGVQLNFVDASWEKPTNEVASVDIWEIGRERSGGDGDGEDSGAVPAPLTRHGPIESF